MGGFHPNSQPGRALWLEILGALALAFLFLWPRLSGAEAHPLHDLGFNLHVLERLDAAPDPAAWIQEASRLRPERFYPLYWAYQHLLWRLGGRSLDLFFWGNLLLLALLLLGTGRLAARLGGRAWLAWVFLLASPGLLENAHTLMKQELLLAVLEIWAYLALLSRRWISTLLLLFLAGLLKETALFTAPALLILCGYQYSLGRRRIALLSAAAALLVLALGVLAILARTPGPYTRAFTFSPGGILHTFSFYLRREGPLFLFLPGAALLWGGALPDLERERRTAFLGALLLFLFWAGGYLPWKLPQVRYLLPAFTFLAPLSAAAWSLPRGRGFPSRAGALLFLAGALVSLPWAVSREYREGEARLKADRAVSRALAFAARLPAGTALRVLLPEDEPLLEFRFRLALQEKRPDITVLPALVGKDPARWITGLKELARTPPEGDLLLVPVARGLPTFADRVFPVTEEWSATLEQAVKTLLGFVAVPAARLGSFREGFQVGFLVYRFQGGSSLELFRAGKDQPGRTLPFRVEGCLPKALERSPLEIVLEVRPPSPPPELTWNGKSFPLEGAGPGRFQVLLPADRPGPADPNHRFLGSQVLQVLPGKPTTRLRLLLLEKDGKSR